MFSVLSNRSDAQSVGTRREFTDRNGDALKPRIHQSGVLVRVRNVGTLMSIVCGSVDYGVIVEDEELSLKPEEFLLVPRGTAHTFGNGADEVARLLVIHAPAMDAYFAGLHDLWNRDEPPTTDEERALMARFGMETT